MFTSKRKKIRTYLQSISDVDKTGFDFLLLDCLNGILKSNLKNIGMTKIEIHVDWHDHMKCIAVQGRFKKYYMDLHIYPDEFCLSFDLDEPDEDKIYPIESKNHFYLILANTAHDLK